MKRVLVLLSDRIMLTWDIVNLLSATSWLIFIIAGVISTLSFLSRIADVFEYETISEWMNFIAYSGFVVGVVILAVTAANLIGPHLNPAIIGHQTQWDTTVLGLITGFALSLKPIKDMKWAALITLGVGGIIMILFWVFVPSPPGGVLIAIIVILMLIVYIALKFIEDFYILLSSVLTSPPVAIGLGVLCVLEGILLFFGSSLLTLATGF